MSVRISLDLTFRAPLIPETALEIMRRDVGRHLCPTMLTALEDGLASAVLRAA